MDNFNFKQGDRVQLIIDIPDTTTDVHPVDYKCGDITSLRRKIGGRYELIVNYCVKVAG
jgi:hypothetical protein